MTENKGGGAGRPLLPHDAELLAASAIEPEVIAERGYYTATRKSELEALGFKRGQCIVPALVIPIRSATGQLVTYQIRPHWPRIGENGRPVKYESPAMIPPALDVPPRVTDRLRRTAEALWITEGARKADSAVSAGLVCVSVPGVWAWARRLNGDARTVLPDLARIGFHERRVILAFDSDVMEKPAVHKALAAFADYLQSRGATVLYLYLPELEPGEKTGVDDFLAAGHDIGELWDYIADELRAPRPEKSRREAWPTANLLWEVEQWLCRHVVFPSEHHVTTLALWTLHTWCFDRFAATPYLNVCSPVKRSGKSRTLETLELLCRSPLKASSITEAALFQAVEARRPTLLIDEVDTLFSSRSERAELLRGVLNDGYREGGKVLRGSQDGEPVEFATFCPKALSGINTGRMPDTITDRAITISLKRKMRGEPVRRLRRRDVDQDAGALAERFADWAAEHGEQLGDWRLAEPILEISDRAEEVWEPLLAIAELAGDDWPNRARGAAVALSGVDAGSEDHGELLLTALRGLFDADEALFSKDICEKLNADTELPFHDYRKGAGINPSRLGRMLRPYEIQSKTVRRDSETAKGYQREQFEDAWSRYVDDSPAQTAAEVPSQASQRHTDHETPANGQVSDVTLCDVVTAAAVDPNGAEASQRHKASHKNPCKSGVCDVVTAVTAQVEDFGGAVFGACANRERHAEHHRPHPVTGRVVCWLCYPPAAPND